jgi:outer membrane lipoprotein-sorting protein
MQAKDKFFEKINLLILIFTLCFSHSLNAENIYNEIFNYNNGLKNSSANFIQTNNNYVQEGEIFFGTKRVKITYENPRKLTLILSEKKGIYINHELEESEFFITKKSYIKFFFDVFYTKIDMKKMNIKHSDRQIEINEKIQIDNNFFEIKLIYENKPIKLRRLEIISNDEKIQMGFFDHRFQNVFDKSFFSMIDPYLN